MQFTDDLIDSECNKTKAFKFLSLASILAEGVVTKSTIFSGDTSRASNVTAC
jgi:hypothetical protein